MSRIGLQGHKGMMFRKGEKIVIFLNYFEEHKKAIPYIKKVYDQLQCEPIIVSSNFDTGVLSKHFDCQIVYFDDFLSREDYNSINDYASTLAKNWHLRLPKLQGITEYDNIQFGRLVELEAQQSFSNSIKNLEIILQIAKRFTPDRMILIEQKGLDSFGGLVKFINNTLKISASHIMVPGSDNAVFSAIKKYSRFSIDLACSALDSLVTIFVRSAEKNPVLMDHRLIPSIKDVNKEFPTFPFVVESGLRVRWNLLVRKKSLFLPLSKYNYLMSSDILPAFYRNLKFYKTSFENKVVFKYKGLVINSVLEKVFQKLIVFSFPRLYRTLIFIQSFLKRINPRLVVLREAIRALEQGLTLTAKQQGVHTLVIQHGANNEPNVYSKLHADSIALWGPADKEWYHSFGNDVSRSKVTGNPNYDEAYFFKHKDSGQKKTVRELLSNIGVDIDKEIVVYLATFVERFPPPSVYYPTDYSLSCLKKFLETVENHPDKQFIIKLHPFYNRSCYPAIAQETKNHPNVFIIEDINLIELYNVSSLVISDLFSTAIILALLSEKPVISLNFFKREEPIPLAKRGVAIEVNKPEDISSAIDRVFKDKALSDFFKSNRKPFIYDYAYRIDGMATHRVKEFMKVLTNSNSGKI